MIESPCIKVCVMDEDDRYCVGCKRTLNEIARWGEMSEPEQATVLAKLPERRAALSDVAEIPATPLA